MAVQGSLTAMAESYSYELNTKTNSFTQNEFKNTILQKKNIPVIT